MENGIAPKSREMYFAIHQAIARDERRPGLYREYAPDFFDLIIVDERHRGGPSQLQIPPRSFAIFKSGRAFRSRQPCDLEPWMVFEQLNKTLPDHSGRAEYSDWDLIRHLGITSLI